MRRLIERAWAAMWDGASPYFVPRALASALPRLSIPDFGPIPLYRSADGENVEIVLRGCTLEGMPSLRGGAVTVSARGVEAAVSWPSLTFTGEYAITGSRTVRGGIDAAIRAAIGAPGSPPPPEYLDLARQNEQSLVQTTNGLTLVGTYYDNSDAMNAILDQPNAFTQAWAQARPGGGTTADYMAVTADAAANPNDPAFPVGSENYRFHAAYMRSIFTTIALEYAGTSGEPENEFTVLADATTNFEAQTNRTSGPMTVADVYQTVNNTPPGPPPDSPLPDVVRRGHELAERDYPMWAAQAAETAAARRAAERRRSSVGRFAFRFAIDSATLRGAASQDPAFTSLGVVVPPPALDLDAGSEASFTREARERLAGAEWLRRALAARIASHLGGAPLLDLLTSLFRHAAAAHRGDPAIPRRMR